MKKLLPLAMNRRDPLDDVIVTSEAGAYSAIDGAGPRGLEGRLIGRFHAKKAYKVRQGRKALQLLSYEGQEVKRSGPLAVRSREVIKSAKIKAPTHMVVRLKSRPSYALYKDLDFRVLAEETLFKVNGVDYSTAVDLLTTVIKSVSIGKPATAKRRKSFSREESAPVVDDPLAAARARGRRYALEQYENPANLALLEARDYAGRNERSINELRQSGQLYALLPPGKTRGFRYPKWQFDAEPDRVKAALKPFVEANANCWVIHSFMTRKRDSLGGRSPADVVLDESVDIMSVVELAQRDLVGEQGAQ
ncbi:hypothetical protein [Paraburkholderia kirstenboschensis]|uniref:Antitoxin Xre/MbcA/ParS-like toxin-binding domain-containing protein n=1 Tax=Paraburkholderia kirstenboschensis TaxID=1245436 RepID=A0ABZ0ECG6_9BURK|nr:hypothetical protein [Paraburkholderia kirstenboschensis]WOD14154.1 hypothetical protein RW095_01115 [Paraburkholderia kirstenboschensis]